MLDALILPLVEDDGAIVAEWRSARRVRRKPGPVQDTGRVAGDAAAVGENVVPLRAKAT